jgi:diguanylate cyclase (GGDEF)-like protein
MVLSAISLIAGLILALIITYNISRPLNQLKRATAAISEGQFDYPVDIIRGDEIGSLAKAFRTMKERLKILETKLRDESPLTGLPGNRAIEEVVEKRFLEGTPFSLCHLDLDHFKPYVDKYGYAWGSEVLKEVADILKEKHHSNDEDSFFGHIGGDDFIIIADPKTAEVMSRDVVQEFDRRIMKFFTQGDRDKGFIVERDRHGIFRKFPLVSLSIAIVTNNNSSQFESALDMAQKAAELKEYVKAFSGSNVLKLEEWQNSIE